MLCLLPSIVATEAASTADMRYQSMAMAGIMNNVHLQQQNHTSFATIQKKCKQMPNRDTPNPIVGTFYVCMHFCGD